MCFKVGDIHLPFAEVMHQNASQHFVRNPIIGLTFYVEEAIGEPLMPFRYGNDHFRTLALNFNDNEKAAHLANTLI